MIFDGDCTFCRRWISRWQGWTGPLVAYVPFQDPRVSQAFPELDLQAAARAVHFVDADGLMYAGAEAVARALAVAGIRWPLALYRFVPGIRPIGEALYRQIATHRVLFSKLTRWLWGSVVEQPEHVLVRSLFLRLLGLVYLCAFLSLANQVDGLIGEHGILPAAQFMDVAREFARANGSWHAHFLLPTLCWLSSSDAFLHLLSWGGVALSALVIGGVATAPALALLWMFYLSLSVVSDVFLGYQWDGLLLEAGLLAIFFAPRQLIDRARDAGPPSLILLWLFRWLLFRLLFASGIVKLATHDPPWRNLTALMVHYQTQPLPTWIGWYAHHLPAWVQRLSCSVMFAIELGAPLLIILPRRPRIFAAASIALLMGIIAATGNYGFFNLLTVALCVLLLDDAALRRVWPWRTMARWVSPTRVRRWPRWVSTPITACVLVVTLMNLLGSLRDEIEWPAPFVRLHQLVGPLRSFNGYGLFANMTTTRPEIVIEGSIDGERWLAYEFQHKPGELTRRPDFVAPMQPRLDWQMWFEALRVGRAGAEPSEWFISFCERLLEGSPSVLQLLATNPFPDAPPRYIRALAYDYRFTDLARVGGAWWQRRALGIYFPATSLR
jgi:predicted DCC family thiol-disulfide oxidoreductase YuxK